MKSCPDLVESTFFVTLTTDNFCLSLWFTDTSFLSFDGISTWLLKNGHSDSYYAFSLMTRKCFSILHMSFIYHSIYGNLLIDQSQRSRLKEIVLQKFYLYVYSPISVQVKSVIFVRLSICCPNIPVITIFFYICRFGVNVTSLSGV